MNYKLRNDTAAESFLFGTINIVPGATHIITIKNVAEETGKFATRDDFINFKDAIASSKMVVILDVQDFTPQEGVDWIGFYYDDPYHAINLSYNAYDSDKLDTVEGTGYAKLDATNNFTAQYNDFRGIHLRDAAMTSWYNIDPRWANANHARVHLYAGTQGTGIGSGASAGIALYDGPYTSYKNIDAINDRLEIDTALNVSGAVTANGGLAHSAIMVASGVGESLFGSSPDDGGTVGSYLRVGPSVLQYLDTSTSDTYDIALAGHPVTTDCNDLKRQGLYRVDTGTPNLPATGYFAVTVSGNGTNVVSQMAIHYQTGEAYYRAFNNVWSPWNRSATTLEISSSYLPLSGGLMTGKIARNTTDQGYQVGSYTILSDINATGCIYAMGTAYLPTATTLSNMYGIGYGYNAAPFIPQTGAASWGQYVAADGNARIFLGATENSTSVFTENLEVRKTLSTPYLHATGSTALAATFNSSGDTYIEFEKNNARVGYIQGLASSNTLRIGTDANKNIDMYIAGTGTVFKATPNRRITAPLTTIADVNAAGDRSLVTREYYDSKVVGDDLTISNVTLPDEDSRWEITGVFLDPDSLRGIQITNSTNSIRGISTTTQGNTISNAIVGAGLPPGYKSFNISITHIGGVNEWFVEGTVCVKQTTQPGARYGYVYADSWNTSSGAQAIVAHAETVNSLKIKRIY